MLHVLTRRVGTGQAAADLHDRGRVVVPDLFYAMPDDRGPRSTDVSTWGVERVRLERVHTSKVGWTLLTARPGAGATGDCGSMDGSAVR